MPNGSCVPSKCFPELNLSRQSSVKASPLCRLPPLPGRLLRRDWADNETSYIHFFLSMVCTNLALVITYLVSVLLRIKGHGARLRVPIINGSRIQ